MLDVLFEIPWYVPVGLAAAGIALFIYANNRLDTQLKRGSLGLVLVAVLLAVVSYLVDTPKENVENATRAFVKAVVAQDKAQLGALLSTQAIAGMWGKPQIIDGAVHYAKATGLTGARVTGLEVKPVGPMFTSYLSAWSNHTGTSTQLPMNSLTSQWKIEWRQVGESWQIEQITPLQIGPVMREQIEAQYLSRPVK